MGPDLTISGDADIGSQGRDPQGQRIMRNGEAGAGFLVPRTRLGNWESWVIGKAQFLVSSLRDSDLERATAQHFLAMFSEVSVFGSRLPRSAGRI